MSNDRIKVNILELPAEVLREILSYVPNQLTVGQVCKAFYNISCKLKAYRLNITSGIPPTFKMIVDIEEDDETYDSILNSGRKIDTLSIDRIDTNKSLNRVRMRKVIELIGQNVKILVLNRRSFNIHGLNLLNVMPNLEILDLSGISCKGLKVPQDFKLRLHKLKQVKVEKSHEKVLEVFDHLPDDVLRKVSLFKIRKSGPTREYFQNQQSINHVIFLDEESVQYINLRPLKLKTFRNFNSQNIETLLKGQDELASFAGTIFNSTEEFLNFACNELKALEILDLELLSKTVDLSKISKLKNLKKLSLGAADIERLDTLRSNSLQYFDYCFLTKEDFLSLSINCPNLCDIGISNIEDFAIDEMINLFPKLQKLTCDTDRITFADGWENQSLKHLHSTDGLVTGKAVDFMKRCRNLKTLSIGHVSLENFVDSSVLKRLLTEVPSVTTLCLHNLINICGIIKRYGKNLQCIHHQNGRDMYKHEYYATMKETFKDIMPVSKMMTEDEKISFYFKKYGRIEKCCEKLEELY